MNGLRARKTELIEHVEHLKEHKPDFGMAILIKKEIAYSIVYTDDIME